MSIVMEDAWSNRMELENGAKSCYWKHKRTGDGISGFLSQKIIETTAASRRFQDNGKIK
jgi:hypothetical protein